MHLTTTLSLLKAAGACTEGYRKLKQFLGSDYDKEKEINITVILESNGIADALWALQAVREPDAWKLSAELAADFVEEVLPIFEGLYSTDNRPRLAVQAIRDYVAGKITQAELRAASDAAYAASRAASYAASRAAYAAYAASDAAYAASRAASYTASRAASYAASRAASYAASRAASYAASRAASYAASRAAYAASDAASDAAYAASRAASEKRQTELFKARIS